MTATEPTDVREPDRGRFTGSMTAWQMTTELLQVWEESRPQDPAWQQGHGDRYDRWAEVHGQVWKLARSWDGQVVDSQRVSAVLQVIETALPELGVDAFHAAAFAIDEAAHALFAGSWCDAEAPFTLDDGQLFYVGEPPPLDYAWSTMSQSTRPSSTTEPRLGELPHVRRHAQGEVEVVIDGRWRVELEAIARSGRPLVAAHPNGDFEEFDFPRTGETCFPVTVEDRDGQIARYGQLLQHVCDPKVDARIVVFPELTSSPDLVALVSETINLAPGTRLVVAGSWHEERDGDGANVAVGVVARSAAVLEHRKMAAFIDANHTKEGIRRGRQLLLYDAGPFRVAVAICKDILDQNVRDLLARHGVNLLLVPALSDKTEDFAAAVDHLVRTNQAVTLVVNGALTASGARVEPSSVLGQPFRPGTVIQASHPGPAPGLTMFRVGHQMPIG